MIKIPFLPLCASIAVLFSQVGHAQPTSSLVYPGANGKLQYNLYANESQTSVANRIIDFSTAGYMGGGVAIPWVPVVKTLDPDPLGGDDYARIQAAINEIAAMPLSSAGFRGTLLLTAGAFRVSERVTISTSGIVIRGAGQGTNGTVVTFTSTNIYGVDPYAILFYFKGSSGWVKVAGTETPITDAVVPAGTFTMTLGSTAGLSVGSRIIVHRTPNQAWIDWLKMKAIFWVPDVGVVDWFPQDYDVEAPRTITAINGNTITLDAPITQAIETQYGGGEVYRYTFNGAIRQSGIERIRLESSFVSPTDENHGWEAVRFSQAEDCWARQVTAKYFAFGCVNAWIHAKNITVEDCAMLDHVSQVTGGRRYSFNIDRSSAILLQRNYTRNGRHDYVSSARTLGPTAFVDSLAVNTLADIGPHHRYAEGILFDNIKGGEIAVQNRGSSGSGHGWSGAQIVLWNCVGTQLRCDAPKGAMNFALGCTGTKTQGNPWTYGNEPYGIWESLNTPITPRSLYYKQLEDRLGTAAMRTVTTQSQRNGNIFTELTSWAGGGAPPSAPSWLPVQVSTFANAAAVIGTNHPINATVINPLPSSFPTTKSWTQISGPGTAAFANASAAVTTVVFPVAGTYVIQYAVSQTDTTDSIIYSDSDTVAITADASWDAGGGANKEWSTLTNWADDADPAGKDVVFASLGLIPAGTTNALTASKSINSLAYFFDSATNQHTTEISSGQALTVNGSFSVLTGTAPTAPTNVSISGASGTLEVTGTTFTLPNQAVSTTNTTTSLDMSGLGTLTANLSGESSLFRVGANTGFSGVSTGNNTTLKLAADSTITASTVGVSDVANFNAPQKMLLGSGATIINTNTFSIANTSGGRSSGEVSFNSGTGSLLLRGLTGGSSSVTTMNMVNTSVNTAGNVSSIVNLGGHSVDARINTLNMAIRRGAGNANNAAVSTATLTFDQGNLDVGTVTMAKNGNASLIGNIAATINIGGGTASFGSLNMADNTTGNTTRSTTATLNLTGGVTTVAGDIVEIGGIGASAVVSLAGGTLDMTNGNIGDATKPVTLTLASGTLKNVAQINGGGGITKTTTGILTLSGTNTYTGDTTISDGTLIATTPNFADTSTISIGPTAILNLPNAGTDIVAALSINGVTQPAGKTYGNASSVLPVIATSAITGPGTIRVPSGSGTPFTEWAATFLSDDVSDPAGDNDNDGLVNQQEFAFGLSPIDGSSVNPILVQLDNVAGTFTYQRRAGTGLTYKILTSTTLAAGNWAEDHTAVQSAIPIGDNETVIVTLTGAPLSAPKLFVRVSAE